MVHAIRLISPTIGIIFTERTIKLWQLTELPTQSFTNLNFPVESGCRRKVVIRSLSDIKVPVCLKNYGNTNIRVQNKKVFARAHGFSIVGLSPSADRETFFSADPLRINMWNLEVTNEVFSILLPMTYLVFINQLHFVYYH